jgi:hypothetical protein
VTTAPVGPRRHERGDRPYRGGTCAWRQGTGHEPITPFQRIACRLTLRLHLHAVRTPVEAFADPGPAFITDAP